MQPFARPSNNKEKIYLKEARVKQVIGFAGSRASHSEQVTTLFLNAVQEAEHATDSADWSEGDRLTALLWYHIHTATPSEMYSKLEYVCDHCKKRHTHEFDIRELASVYMELKGSPFREFSVNGKLIRFVSVTGKGLEAVQEVKRNAPDPESEEAKARMLMERVIWSIEFDSGEADRKEKGEWINSLTVSEYKALILGYYDAQVSLRHGIQHVYSDGDTCLPIPPHECPEDTTGGAMTTLHWPFLSLRFIPQLG